MSGTRNRKGEEMVKIETLVCDMCGKREDKELHWDQKHSIVSLVCPRDGINGGNWSGDWCSRCRKKLNDFIDASYPEAQASSEY